MRKWWTTAFVTLGIILLSLPELFVEAKHGVENYGYLGGAIIALYYAHKAYTRHQFRERDKRWEAKFDAIGKAVGAEWGLNGQHNGLNPMPPQLLRRLFSFLRKGIPQVHLLRRRRKMNQNINFVTLFPGMIAAIKLILQPFGIDIPDEHINALVNGAASLMVIVGIFYNHFKPKKQSTPTIGAAPQTPYNPESYQ
jgi:uncharacterized membrane protein